ncbi:MAG: hypothetical protein H8F28_16310 [Fibrella sp.]|nr:hypothetical protein [Armatimonadota bacterium]
MRTLPVTASDDEIKQWVRDWIAILGEERYDEAVEMLHPNLSRYGQYDFWTGERLKTILRHYGLHKPIPEDPRVFRPAPVDDAMRHEFEKHLKIYPRPSLESDWTIDNVSILVDMPLRDDNGVFLSDMTAEMMLRRVGESEMGVELLSAHVM